MLGLKDSLSIRTIAESLGRSEESTTKKAIQLGFTLPSATILTSSQERATNDAQQQRTRAARCRELAEIAGDALVSHRLSMLASEYEDQAVTIEAQAHLGARPVESKLKQDR